MSVVFVAGTRPNFVKLAPLVRAYPGTIVHTGQHYDRAMAGLFFEELGIPAPDVNLGIAGAQTAKIMEAFRAYLVAHERPRGVVVVGDVSSTMACALAAADLAIPVAHVEAGLRSFDRTMPEEIHRIVTDAISELRFATEPAAITNLATEGLTGELVGNVMIDTLVAQLPSARSLGVPARFEVSDYIVATLHRPSNVDDPGQLATLVDMLLALAATRQIVFPVHPRTRARLMDLPQHPNLVLTNPLGYREFLALVDGARCVITDSGGIQEETTYLGIPCFTLRATTERPITLDHTNVMVRDLAEVPGLVANATRKPIATIAGWDGHAANRIADVLRSRWSI
ncbi:MAG: UDP-N-acetylglucosamine 2-epimerase (non-hydrolyzing) [Kofleriaceae bacterium]